MLGLCEGSIPLWIILLVGTKNTVNSPQRLQIYRNRGFVTPKSCFATRSIELNRGRGHFLRENNILATPLENNDQSAFIARLNNISGGAPYGAAMIVMKFGKTQAGKTATLETCNFGKVQFWKRLLL